MIPNLVNEAYMEPCVLLEKTRRPDGEGGWITGWTDGPEFMAAIVMDTTMEARVADHEGMHSVFTVTVDPSTPLAYNDAFRRVSDGQTFRVTSKGRDRQTPSVASFQFMQVNAEEWELPSSADGGA